jgi:hypothetical protein
MIAFQITCIDGLFYTQLVTIEGQNAGVKDILDVSDSFINWQDAFDWGVVEVNALTQQRREAVLQ